jgi:hypothetical protein
MKLRYAGACRLCDAELEKGVLAVYERATKTVRCLECSPRSAVVDAAETTPEAEPDQPNGDVAGASARREYERRKARREDRIRSKHPKLGGLILALSDDPQTTNAWASGAKGEAMLGARLDRHVSESIAVLHDRPIPGTKANVDHIVVTQGGVFVVDAKRYVNKRPELKIEGGVLRLRVERLLVGGRDRTKLVDGVLGQVETVRAALEDEAIPVRGVLCFVEADWPLIGGTFTTRGVSVVWPRQLSKMLDAAGGEVDVQAVRDRLSEVFKPA